MEDTHKHDWTSYDKKMLVCSQCTTVVNLNDLIERAEKRGAKEKEIELLSKLLYANAFKKEAHDRAYARVRSLNPEFNTQQGELL